MKNIDRKFIIEVRAHLKKGWRDQKWHDFMFQPEVAAVCYAIGKLDKGARYAEITAEANKYMEALA